MAWFRIEDEFHGHPKVVAAGNAATGLWVRCGTWSSKYLTDGFIPSDVVRSMGRTGEVDRAVAARLWVPTEGGMLMPDYLDYNPAGASIRERRERDAKRKRREREVGAGNIDHDAAGRFQSRRPTDPFQ